MCCKILSDSFLNIVIKKKVSCKVPTLMPSFIFIFDVPFVFVCLFLFFNAPGNTVGAKLGS